MMFVFVSKRINNYPCLFESKLKWYGGCIPSERNRGGAAAQWCRVPIFALSFFPFFSGSGERRVEQHSARATKRSSRIRGSQRCLFSMDQNLIYTSMFQVTSGMEQLINSMVFTSVGQAICVLRPFFKNQNRTSSP